MDLFRLQPVLRTSPTWCLTTPVATLADSVSPLGFASPPHDGFAFGTEALAFDTTSIGGREGFLDSEK